MCAGRGWPGGGQAEHRRCRAGRAGAVGSAHCALEARHRAPCALLAVALLASLAAGESQCNSSASGACEEAGPQAAAEGGSSGEDGSSVPGWVAELKRDGFVRIPKVLRPDLVFRAKLGVEKSPWRAFEFGNVERIGISRGVAHTDYAFAEVIESIPKEVEDLMFEILGPWSMGAFDTVKLHPIGVPIDNDTRRFLRMSRIHSDFPYGHHMGETGFTKIPKQYPNTIQLLFMLDDFTLSNGGTLILPGSHREGELPMTSEQREYYIENARIVTGDAGDLVIYFGQSWHGISVNEANAPRLALIGQCLPYFYKPMHSMSYMFPNEVALQFPQKVRERLGLNGYHWFSHTGGSPVGPSLPQVLIFLKDAMLFGYPGSTEGYRHLILDAVQRGFQAVPLAVLCLLLGLFCGSKGMPAWCALLRLALSAIPIVAALFLPLSVLISAWGDDEDRELAMAKRNAVALALAVSCSTVWLASRLPSSLLLAAVVPLALLVGLMAGVLLGTGLVIEKFRM